MAASTRKTRNGHGAERGASREGVYLLSISVENVRCFGKKQTLDLSSGRGVPAQWTVLLGENGVGKTTLLQLAYGLMPEKFVFMARSTPRIVPAAINNHDVFDSILRTRSDAKILGALVRGVLCGRIDDHVYKVAVQWGRATTPDEGWDDDRNLSLWCGYGATRRTAGGRDGDSAPRGARTLFDEFANIPDPEPWLLALEYAAIKEGNDDGPAARRRNQAIESLVALLPDVTNIDFPSPDPARPRAEVRALTPFGWVRLGDLSLGYRSMVAWMVDLMTRMFEHYPDSEAPLSEPAVVMIDEIDLHMHPRWQRTVIEYLSTRLPNVQFIVTAHSPLVVQAATDANIVVLRREGDHVVIDNNPEVTKGWRVDQVLTSDLFGLESARPVALEKLLGERAKLLGKAKLSPKDRARLHALEAEIGELPTADTPDDQRAMDVIRRAARALEGGKR